MADPKPGTRRARICAAVRRAGCAGLTSADVCDALGIRTNGVSAQLRQLQQSGLIHSVKLRGQPVVWFSDVRHALAYAQPASVQANVRINGGIRLRGDAVVPAGLVPTVGPAPAAVTRAECGAFASLRPGQYLPTDRQSWAEHAVGAGHA